MGSVKSEKLSLSRLRAANIMDAVQNPTEKLDLDQLFAKYRPIVGFRVKKALGAATPDWEDVVNEIMTNVLDKIQKGEFRGESSIGTFIYTVTSRRIVDHIRSKSRVLKHAPEPQTFPAPHEHVESKERAELIASAIKELKPKYREVLYLYYYRELSRDEVAKRLSISPRRVSERVNYAQKLLRRLIRK